MVFCLHGATLSDTPSKSTKNIQDDALELAELIYDIFIEEEQANGKDEQNNE